jgi:DNA-binding Lrp family transcriptional regulator
MEKLLNDELNLKILKDICSGQGIDVNISELSKLLKKHRNTIRDRVDALFKNEIINRPIFPFNWLFFEYPLMVIARADLPRDTQTKKFIENDPHIFAAFFKKDEIYNTFLIEYHKDIDSHQKWRDTLVKDGKLPPRETRYPSDVMYFSNKNFIKYNPGQMMQLIEKDIEYHKGIINNYKLDKLSVQILKKLVHGEGIKTNEYFLAEKHGIHRKTIERRISKLLEEKIVLSPICRFPRLLVPPDYTLVLSLVEIRKNPDQITGAWRADPHIPIILPASTGRYTHLLFSSFYRIKEHLEWEENLDLRFPGCIGAIWNKYLSPSMMFSIAQQFVSLEIIKSYLENVNIKEG